MVCLSSTSLEKQVQAFASGKIAEYAFPAELTAGERKTVKTAAEKLGLSSQSFGMGRERQIHIFKATSKDSACSSETGSTAESESEEIPTLEFFSIKNSFVHFEEAGATECRDPRIVQSMPNGKFAEGIKLEKDAATEASEIASRKKRPVPVPLLNDEEADFLEPCSGIELFPATPRDDAERCTLYDGVRDQNPSVQTFQWMSSPSAAYMPEYPTTTVLPPAILAPQAPQTFMTAPAMQAPPPPPTPPPSIEILPPAMLGRDSRTTAFSPAMSAPELSPTCLPPAMLARESPATALPPAFWMPSPQATTAAPSPVAMSPATLSPQPDCRPPATFPAPQGGPPCWTPGTSVVICGLANQPAFNGLHGTVSSFDAGCGRYNISLEVAPGKQQVAKIKAQNLLPAQHPVQPPAFHNGAQPHHRSQIMLDHRVSC